MVKRQNKNLRVEKGRRKKYIITTWLTITHNGQNLTFEYPRHLCGLGNGYADVGKRIEEDGLGKPTMAETVSLVNGAFNSANSIYSCDIINDLRGGNLLGFTGTLYVPNKGAYVQDNPEIKGGMPFMDESELIKKLEANDISVRFVPFGYKTGEMTPLEIGKNEYIIALAEEEGAEKLAEVAGGYRWNPCLHSYKSIDKPEIGVSTLNSWGNSIFYVRGDYPGNWGGVYAYGKKLKI